MGIGSASLNSLLVGTGSGYDQLDFRYRPEADFAMDEDAINPVTLLIHLERPHAEYSGIETLEKIVLAELTSSSIYWVDLALKWLESGAPPSDAIARQLQATAETLHRSHQSLRHRCASLARKLRQVAN